SAPPSGFPLPTFSRVRKSPGDGHRGFHWSRTGPGAVNARVRLNHRPLPSYKHHLGNVILTIVELWRDIGADLVRLIGGALTKGFMAATLVAGFVLLLGVLPWQDALADLPASTTEWWFRPALA